MLLVRRKKPYYCLIAPTYEGHWITAFHEFVRAAFTQTHIYITGESGARKRFVVEAEWSGYHSGQRHVCHRTVETLFRAGYENLRYHHFSDGPA